MNPTLPKSGKVRATFHNAHGDSGNTPIFVQINGKAYNIPRNREVVVGAELLRVIDRAVETVWEKDRDDLGTSRGIARPRKVPRFTYTIHGIVKEELEKNKPKGAA